MNYHESLAYFRARLGLHVARLRVALSDGDRGASAVELAFITVALLAVAGIIVAAIRIFAQNQSNTIQTTNP